MLLPGNRVYGCNNFGAFLILMMEPFRYCRYVMEMITFPSVGYHLTFEIKSETSAVNPTILVNLYSKCAFERKNFG